MTARDVSAAPQRRWSRAELGLAGLLLAIAAAAWLLTHRLAMPDMSTGVLTGATPMGGTMGSPVAAAASFLATWTVMMAAMMLPSIVPFTIGISRLMRARHAPRGGLAVLTLCYFLVWIATGAAAYLVLRGVDMLPASMPTLARAGAGVLLAAGIYQLTPLKRVCLRHCRSPLSLVLRHGPDALRGRWGAARVGLRHGGYCLGCCWALMAVLLAVGVMSLVWMAAVASVIAVEKLYRRGELAARILGGALIAAGLVLLVQPAVLPAMS